MAYADKQEVVRDDLPRVHLLRKQCTELCWLIRRAARRCFTQS